MSTRHELHTEGVCLDYGAGPVVQDLTLQIPPGRVTAIVGANGCGKSTLLRAMARLMRPSSGTVILDGKSVHSQHSRQVARILGILPQSPVAPESILVADLVARGRYPHQRWLGQNGEDARAVTAAMQATGTTDLAGRTVDSLSGGQRQRVWVAMALAQDPGILLLDEPTTFLDVSHQLDVLDLLADLNVRSATTVVMVLHDLNLAARYADHLVVMGAGNVLIHGSPADVVTPAVVADAFALNCRVIQDPVTGTPLVIPISRSRVAEHATEPAPASPAGDAVDPEEIRR